MHHHRAREKKRSKTPPQKEAAGAGAVMGGAANQRDIVASCGAHDVRQAKPLRQTGGMGGG